MNEAEYEIEIDVLRHVWRLVLIASSARMDASSRDTNTRMSLAEATQNMSGTHSGCFKVLRLNTEGLTLTERPNIESDGYSLNECEMVELCEGLIKCTSLEVLDLRKIIIKDQQAEKLKKSLGYLSALVELNLDCCRIKIDNITELLKSTCLEQLCLDGNNLSTCFAKEWPKCARLRCVSLNDCLSGESLALLCKRLVSSECNTLQELCLSKNKEGLAASAASVSTVLTMNTQLRTLNLLSCELEGTHLTEVFKGLATCTLLHELNLGNNRVDTNLNGLVNSIQNISGSLQHLHLGACGIGADSMKHLCNVFAECLALETLKLMCNHVCV